jgi:serine/threonine protein kinase
VNKCPACGSRYEGNERFCPVDGQELVVFAEDEPGSWSGKSIGDLKPDAFLGSDRYGEVYSLVGDANAVVKVLHPTIGTQRAQTGNFEADVEAARAIHHPALARYRDVDLAQEPRYISSDHLDGGITLEELVQDGGPLPERAAFLIAARVAEGLQALHSERVFHRNLNPSSVLVTGLNHQILRSDPGAVQGAPLQLRGWAEAHLVRTKDPIAAHQKNPKGFYGRAEYLAPEQAQGRSADERTDIYALGIVLYQLLTGKAPFKSGSFTTTLKRQIYEKPLLPRIARPGLKLDRRAEDLVMRMLHKSPDERFGSADTLLEAFGGEGFTLDVIREVVRAPTDEAHETRALSRWEIREALSRDEEIETAEEQELSIPPAVDREPDETALESTAAEDGDSQAPEDPPPTSETPQPSVVDTHSRTDDEPEEAAIEDAPVEDAAVDEAGGVASAEAVPGATAETEKELPTAEPAATDTVPVGKATESETPGASGESDTENPVQEDKAESGKAAPPPKARRRRRRRKKKTPAGRTGAERKSPPLAASPGSSAEDVQLPERKKTVLSAPISGESTLRSTRRVDKPTNGVVTEATNDFRDAEPEANVQVDFSGDWFAGEGDVVEAEPAIEDPDTSTRYNRLVTVGIIILALAGAAGFYVWTQFGAHVADEDRSRLEEANRSRIVDDRRALYDRFDQALRAGRVLPPAADSAYTILRTLELDKGDGSSDEFRSRETKFVQASEREMLGAYRNGDLSRAHLVAQVILGINRNHAEATRILAIDSEETDPGKLPPPAADDGNMLQAPDAASDNTPTPDEQAALAAATQVEQDDEARKKADDEARKKADDEVRKKADDEARKKADDEVRKKADDEARKKADDEARKKADDEARKKADNEARKKADDEARKKGDDSARKKDEAARKKAETAARRKADLQAKKAADAEATRKRDADKARRKAEAGIRKAEKAKDAGAKKKEVRRLMKLASGQGGGQALATYRKVVSIDSRNHRAHYNIGVKLSEQGNFAGALKHLQRAVKLRGRSSHYRLRLANAYFKTGNKAKAKAEYRKVLDLDPENRAAKAMIKRF